MKSFRPPALEPDAVHVWSLELALDRDALRAAESLLSDDEIVLADCFLEERHRERFVACRSQVRALLAAYVGGSAAELDLVTGPNGKPALRDAPDLHFNTTHCEDRALFAVTRLGPVGVDLERVRAWEDLDELEPLVFTDPELEWLAMRSAEERRRGFFRLWTHKEALVKATGLGLSLAPDTFAVDLAGARLDAPLADGLEWRFADVTSELEWPAAVALAAPSFRVLALA